jgi:hypothetical protein
MGLTAKIKAAIEYRKTGSPDLGTAEAKYAGADPIDLASGTGSNQADLVYSDTRTLAASANETLDLTSLIGPLGEAVNFAKIKAILIKAAAGNTNNVVVGDAAADPFLGPLGGTTPTIAIPPGGEVLLAAPVGGWATSGATDLKVANSAGSTGVTYTIIAIGTSA